MANWVDAIKRFWLLSNVGAKVPQISVNAIVEISPLGQNFRTYLAFMQNFEPALECCKWPDIEQIN